MERSKNDFTEGTVLGNIVRMSVPLTLALLVNVLYSLVDRIYIGHIPEVGTAALTGIGIASPVIAVISAFQALCSTGGAPLCSIARGKGDTREAELYLGNAYTILIGMGIALTVLGEMFRDPLLRLVGASDSTIIYASDYLGIYMLGTVFVMVGLGMNPFINSQGFAKTGMLTVMLGAVVNIILDPIFIFLLNMGVRGAALATIIAQMCSAVWVFSFLRGKKAILRLTARNMKLVPEIVGRMLSLGVTGFVMSFTNGAVSMVYNSRLRLLDGDIYVSAMTITSSIREFVFMPLNGFSSGAQPVIGFNYGAGKYDRVRSGIKTVTLLLFAYAFFAWALIISSPAALIRVFNDDPELIRVGERALRLFYAVYFVSAFQMAGQSIFTSLGMTKQAIFFSIFRKVIIVIPMALILPELFSLGVDGVFLSEPVSEVLGGVTCYCTMLATVLPKLKSGSAQKNG